MRKQEEKMLELKASIQSLTLAMQTLEDSIIARILDDLKSQLVIGVSALMCDNILLVMHGGRSSHSAGLKHNDADDMQHHEPGVHIHDDILGVDGEHVTHVDDVIDEAMVGDVTLQSNDAEGEHVLLPESIIDASVEGEEDPDSVVAEKEHLPRADAFVEAAARAMVLYQSTFDAVETRSSSP
ncbi:Uncharacterized protein TCM_035349 [Theobroma cacao]|uniref:Uncharacterized protein n=1 Tax=Theobroma cacao TaxID=3641 RepID=A0A061FHL8_THECC|nr:Uncharacterized protein TCM_035349 [Theobroma cacao]